MNGLVTGTSRKQLAVHAIAEREGRRQASIWLEVGVAFANQDGNINLILDAFPVGTNRLQVREQRFPEESRMAALAPPRWRRAEEVTRVNGVSPGRYGKVKDHRRRPRSRRGAGTEGGWTHTSAGREVTTGARSRGAVRFRGLRAAPAHAP